MPTTLIYIAAFFVIDIIMVVRFCYVCKKQKKQQHETSGYFFEEGKVNKMLYEIFKDYAEVD